VADAGRREQFAWAMYDVANSGYTTVVLTTVFSAYFVAEIAGGLEPGMATFLWTLSIAIANALVLLSGPLVGAVADYRAAKKRFLGFTTVGCIGLTVVLGFVSPGSVGLGMAVVIGATVMFAAGENLIAAFLPEIAPKGHMGRLSGYGWGLGYVGGIATLALCLVYVSAAQARGEEASAFVPVTLWITAVVFALAALPTFIWLKERAVPRTLPEGRSYMSAGFAEVRATFRRARHYRDLFRFLATLIVFQAGVSTVIVVAAIFAQEELGFTSQQLIVMVMIVNVTAAVGAFVMGHYQDRFGSARALALSLCVWILAIVVILFSSTVLAVWVAANLIGFAMGSSQAAGRALVGHFTPVARAGEFFGLWGLAARLAAIIGPISYGAISFLSGGSQRLAILSTLAFFIAGLMLLLTVNEERGKRAAIDA
jgi:UMF1 family MFS transporter